MQRRELYKPILEDKRNWPAYQLSQRRDDFLEEVALEAIARIKELRPSSTQLADEIEVTVYREQNRMKRNRWRVDPPDDKAFWERVKDSIIRFSTRRADSSVTEESLLNDIVRRYTREIAGGFRIGSYSVAKWIIKFCFSRLLNGSQVKRFGAIFSNEYGLEDKVSPKGEIELLRKLAARGTLVVVPTHFSHLDSIVASWLLHFLGVPPLIYGAGLNLFNMKVFAYFMNSLGAYKVDRRKKNLLYVETLKAYSCLALQHGAHSLFFPGGTRSRSGAIETHLQLGLLSTPIEAQRNMLMRSRAAKDTPSSYKKIFIIPVTFNYHFVLEAPDIIEDYLNKKGRGRYLPESGKYGVFQLFKVLFKFFTKGSNISASIGPALDVLGNRVDEEGNSLDANGRFIDIADYFISNGEVSVDRQRTKEYTRILSQRIVAQYHRIGYIYASHLAAFTAFEMWQKKYPKLDLFDLLRMPEEDMEIEYTAFRDTFDRLRQQVYRLEEEDKACCGEDLLGELDEVIQQGLDNVGIFHADRPLLKDRKNRIVTRDLNLLYYYHNRLSDYALESFV